MIARGNSKLSQIGVYLLAGKSLATGHLGPPLEKADRDQRRGGKLKLGNREGRDIRLTVRCCLDGLVRK